MRSRQEPNAEDFAQQIAALVAAAHRESDPTEIFDCIVQGRARREGHREVARGLQRSLSRPERKGLHEVVEKVEARFPGKLSRGAALEQASVRGAQQGRAPGAACVLPLGSNQAESRARALPPGHARGRPPAMLTRPQRRVLVRAKQRQLNAMSRRYAEANEQSGTGVWSRSVYRQIRAAAQDASGKAAECVLYMLGTQEAVKLGKALNPRVPMDRRRIALVYAITSAPGSVLGENLKLGFALGLFSAVLADPNNPNMHRDKRFRPGRRTLSSDLSWLEEQGILKRWQVPAEVAAPCEMKLGPYPTNRYFTPKHRSGSAMLELAVALEDVPPVLRPNPAEEWTADDARALEEIRDVLLAELASVSPKPSG